MEIDEALAKKIMNACLHCGRLIDTLVSDIKDEGNEKIDILARAQLAQVMGTILADIMNPIGELHPKIYPKSLRPTSRQSKIGAAKTVRRKPNGDS